MTSSAQQVVQANPSTRPRRHLLHIRELDGVRGLAAIMVFFHHVCFTSIAPEGWGRSVLLLRTLSVYGSYGVDLFFVLSGFLITSLLIEARNTPSYYQDFYWKRALRILPLYLLCLLGVLLFVPGSRDYVILSALFISNFAWIFHVLSIGPFWTLAIEEQFYLIWPTVVRRRSVAQLRRWAVSLGLTVVALRFIAAIFGHYDYYFTFFRCDGLAFGAFLACWFYQRDSSSENAAKDAKRTHETSAMALGILLGIVLIALSARAGTTLRATAFFAAFRQTGTTLFNGSLIALLIRYRGHISLSVLRSPLLTFFGLISYAMYMTHLYVLLAYDHLRGPLQGGDNSAYITRFFLILAGTIALCMLTRYLVELPAMSLRRYVLAKPRIPDPEEPPLPLGNM